jgi:hypothetical protein
MRLATRKGATCSTEERPQEALDRYHRDVTVRHTAAIQVAPTRDFVGYNRMTEQQDNKTLIEFLHLLGSGKLTNVYQLVKCLTNEGWPLAGPDSIWITSSTAKKTTSMCGQMVTSEALARMSTNVRTHRRIWRKIVSSVASRFLATSVLSKRQCQLGGVVLDRWIGQALRLLRFRTLKECWLDLPSRRGCPDFLVRFCVSDQSVITCQRELTRMTNRFDQRAFGPTVLKRVKNNVEGAASSFGTSSARLITGSNDHPAQITSAIRPDETCVMLCARSQANQNSLKRLNALIVNEGTEQRSSAPAPVLEMEARP